jgi:hypothetical protein
MTTGWPTGSPPPGVACPHGRGPPTRATRPAVARTVRSLHAGGEQVRKEAQPSAGHEVEVARGALVPWKSSLLLVSIHVTAFSCRASARASSSLACLSHD